MGRMFTKKKPKKRSYLLVFMMHRSCKAFIRVYLSPALVAGKRRHTVHFENTDECGHSVISGRFQS
jgi:hypothetical protein